MDVDELPAIDPYVDYTEIPAIHQKRIIAFINHFLLRNVSFLNNFAQSCESRMLEFQYKLQKIEASLLILESKLASIPLLNEDNTFNNNINISKTECLDENVTKTDFIDNIDMPTNTDNSNIEIRNTLEFQTGPIASKDGRFVKFFKMLQFGVPLPAVRLKMANEGFDPDILDRPNDVIPGYQIISETENTSDSSS